MVNISKRLFIAVDFRVDILQAVIFRLAILQAVIFRLDILPRTRIFTAYKSSNRIITASNRIFTA